MVDDPDDRLSSDEMLRAARGKEPTRPDSPRMGGIDDEPGAGPANTDAVTDEEGPAHPEHGQTFMVDGCDIRPNGNVLTRIQGRYFALFVQDRLVGRIKTGFRPPPDGESVSHRRTSIVFAEKQSSLPQWDILAEVPGAWTSKKTLFGEKVEKPDPVRDRVVSVVENYQTIRMRDLLVATTDGQIPGKTMAAKDEACVVVTDGKRFTLSPPWKAKSGSIDNVATLHRYGRFKYSGWPLTADESAPLSVVLLHWHLLLGDWKVSEGSGGSG